MNVITMRYRRFHPSYVIGWASAGLLAGIGLAHIVSLQFSQVVFVLLLLVIVIGMYARKWWAMGMVFVACVFLGMIRGSDMKGMLTAYGHYQGKDVSVVGVIDEDAVLTERHTINTAMTQISVNGFSVPGSIYITLKETEQPFRRGDRVEVRGKLGRSFGRYQASVKNGELRNVIRHNNVLMDLRDAFARSVQKYITEPAASLGLGFVVGQRSSLPEDIDDKLRIVGLTHIVVASGYNLTILVRFARRSLENHSKYLAFMGAFSLMISFIMISGASPSLVRAGAVTGLSLLAWYYGRRFHPLLLILYVAAATALVNPLYEWYDIGWYLSFLAFGGVLLIAPLISEAIRRFRNKEQEDGAYVQVVIETIAAQLVTLPLILTVFGTLPLLSVVANMLVAPVIPAAMLLTAVTGVAGMVINPIAHLSGAMASIVIDYVLAVVVFLSQPEWAQLDIHFSPAWMIASFVVITAGTVVLYSRLRFSYREQSFIE